MHANRYHIKGTPNLDHSLFVLLQQCESLQVAFAYVLLPFISMLRRSVDQSCWWH